MEVLRLMAHGRSTEEIGATLFVALNTVRNHVSSILTKLGAHSKLEAVAIAARDHVISRSDLG
jgi:DNA-binding NarL/FixJ family response regulator